MELIWILNGQLEGVRTLRLDVLGPFEDENAVPLAQGTFLICLKTGLERPKHNPHGQRDMDVMLECGPRPEMPMFHGGQDECHNEAERRHLRREQRLLEAFSGLFVLETMGIVEFGVMDGLIVDHLNARTPLERPLDIAK